MGLHLEDLARLTIPAQCLQGKDETLQKELKVLFGNVIFACEELEKDASPKNRLLAAGLREQMWRVIEMV